MRTKILIATLATVALAQPAMALAEKFSSVVSANVSDSQFEIYGVVQADVFACEKRREVRLYGPDFGNNLPKGGGQGFRRYDEEKTNRFGEYQFFAGIRKARQRGIEGEFFVRALRKDFPGNVCRRADSNSVFLNFND